MGKIYGYIMLGKPRIASLLIFSGISTYIYASDQLNFINLIYFSLLAVMIVYSANSLNSYLDYKYDMIMDRTRSRPIPSGLITRSEALNIGLTSMILSLIGLYYLYGLATVFSALFGTLYYIIIYTYLLKNRTIYNTVVGSIAGFMPSVTGWLATGENINLELVLICLLIFFWSPPHFWSLAYTVREEYRETGFLMLPAVKTKEETRLHIFAFYTVTIIIYIFLIYMLRKPLAKAGTLLSTTLLLTSIYKLAKKFNERTTWVSFKLSTASLFTFYIFLFISGLTDI